MGMLEINYYSTLGKVRYCYITTVSDISNINPSIKEALKRTSSELDAYIVFKTKAPKRI